MPDLPEMARGGAPRAVIVKGHAGQAKLGGVQVDRAAQAFQTSLQFDPHDSTAYTNLGLLAMAEGKRDEAINFLAEALWLTPDSQQARDALAHARATSAK